VTPRARIQEGVPSKEVVVAVEDCEATGCMAWNGDKQDVVFFVE
jgi:hypothetical protein